ncbi:site-specific integrase [Plantibacter sp. MCCC 1A11337]|uniref:site-specific integrase n=1 Tax=Plantibacter sp. MCCC 1A11337 TaxID=2736644 RepID=UPI0015815BC4
MSQRANGEGSIYKRTDGRWTGATYVLAPDGSQKRRQVYGRTKAEVAAKVRDLITQTDSGVPTAVSGWTMQTYAAHWMQHVAPTALRPTTRANYGWILGKHILPILGTKKLEQITPAHVREMHTAIARTGVSAHTVRLAHAVLRSILAEAAREQHIARNVASLVRAPKLDDTEVEPWTAEDASTFLESSRESQFAEIYTLALTLGMRRGELLGLRWIDINAERTELRVRQTAHRAGVGQGMSIGPTKTKRSRRTLPLPERAADALKRRHAIQDGDRRAAGPAWDDTGLVFTTKIGTPIEPSNLRRTFDKDIAAAGVRRIRFHDMRHTCASLLLSQGVQMRVVMEILGHSNMAITSDIYSHVAPATLKSASAAMNSALTDRGPSLD